MNQSKTNKQIYNTMNFKKFSLLFLLSITTFTFAQNPLWIRYSSISPNGKQIAFSYKGDIYTVHVNGGEAHRITYEESFETQPIWSPDGKKIAFVSDRIGNSKDIFIVASKGGTAQRVTEHSGTEHPYSFTKDGKHIIFGGHIQDPAKSALFPTSRLPELYQVSLKDGNIEQILAYPSQNIHLSRSGNKMIYQDLKGFENNWRKHHTSSVTRDILEYDFNTKKSTKLIDWKGEDTNPVYAPNGKGFYFLSERSGSYNVFYSDFNQVKQITHFKEHPVRFLSIANNGTLCFGFDGEVYTLLANSSKPRKVKIQVTNTTDNYDEKKMVFGSGATSAVNSPDGKQIAFVVRGNVFVTSTDYRTTKQITHSVAEEKDVDFRADNRTLAYSSFRDGYWNIYITKISRKEDPNFPNATLIKEEPLIKNDKSEKQYPQFSPDGKEIAFVKDRKRLVVYNFETKKTREIFNEKYILERGGGLDFEWSPDGKWFAVHYVANGHAPYYDIGIVSAKGGEDIFNITESGYFSNSPRWVMNGDAILFSSNRYGMRNHASWGSMRDIMVVFLNKKAYNIYRMNEEDFALYEEAKKEQEKKEKEEKKKEEKSDKKDKEKEEEKKDTKTEEIEIDWDNIKDRIVRLTSNSANYGDAYMTKDGKKLYYLASYESGYDLWMKNLRKPSNKLLKKMNGSWLSFKTDKKQKTLFLLGSKKMQKMGLPSGKIEGISYSAKMKISPLKEQEAMFNYVCREEKARFYRKNMHGVNWEKLTRHYRKLLPYINNYYDFSEMLSEMLGELNVSHTGSGYRPAQSNDKTAELGIFVSFDKGVIIDEILPNTPFDSFQSKVKVGDVIEKIDGVEVNTLADYYRLLIDKTGKRTLVSIYSKDKKERWDEVVKPISAGTFSELLYRRWVKQRQDEVERLSNGRLGYVHIRSMGDGSFRNVYADALGKYYKKEGMVIDIRYNGGGRLHEDVEVFFSGKQYLTQEIRGKDYCEMPSRRWNKPSIMLITEADYSNAHGTPWVYKKMKIGKLVGMPVPGTMTSVNWVRLQNPALYFGIPVIGYRTAEGTYLENDQLEPDVKAELDLDRATKNGQDSQLERAVKELLKELK